MILRAENPKFDAFVRVARLSYNEPTLGQLGPLRRYATLRRPYETQESRNPLEIRIIDLFRKCCRMELAMFLKGCEREK